MKTIRSFFAIRSEEEKDMLQIVLSFSILIGFIFVVIAGFIILAEYYANTLNLKK